MKGNPKVIAELNKALREELTAINQYFLHAEMCENWGYHKLSDFIKKQSIGEMKHAEVLIERILFLDGSPSMMPLELKVGGTVKAMIESDLALEVGAVKQYNDAVALATKEGDNGSRDLLVALLKDEEEHVDFLEAQMHQIKELGYERYLTMQMGEDEVSVARALARCCRRQLRSRLLAVGVAMGFSCLLWVQFRGQECPRHTLLHRDCQQLRAAHHVVQRGRGGFVDVRFAADDHLLVAAHAVHHVHD